MRRLPNSFAGWFPGDEPDREAPTILAPLLKGLPSAPATFLVNAIGVGLIGWPRMSIAILFLNWWLSPKQGSGSLLRAAGYALLATLYVAKIAALWNPL